MQRLKRVSLLPFIVLVAVLGAVHVLVRTSTYGATITPDSVYYLSVAANLSAGEGLQNFRGEGVSHWPPFFPILLAALNRVGIELVDAGRLVSVVAFGLIILLSGLHLRRTLISPLLAVGATLVLATSFNLTHFASSILSEACFILFVLLALTQIESFLTRRAAWPSLALAAVCSALAAVTRFAGVTVIFTGIGLLLLRREWPLAARLKSAACYGAVASVPLVAVLTYNWIVFGELVRSFVHEGEPYSLSHWLRRTLFLCYREVVPATTPAFVEYLLWAGGSLAVLGVAVVCMRHRNELAQTPSSTLWSVLPLAAFACVFLAFIAVVVPLRFGASYMVARFLMPLHVPLVLSAAILLDRFLRIQSEGWVSAVKSASAALILIGCCAVAGHSTISSLTATAQAMESGYYGDKYNTAHWDESETIRYLKANPTDAVMYSNRDGLLYTVLALDAGINVRGKYPTFDDLGKSPVIPPGESGPSGTHFVWLHQFASFYRFDAADLRALPQLEPVAELADGVVFKVNRAYDTAASLRATYKAVVVGEPAIRSTFDVYLGENNTLTYVKQPCTRADTEEPFFLHLFPVHREDLPDVDRLTFEFDWRGVRFDGKCWTERTLPEYAIARIRTGQGKAWQAEFDLADAEQQATPIPGK